MRWISLLVLVLGVGMPRAAIGETYRTRVQFKDAEQRRGQFSSTCIRHRGRRQLLVTVAHPFWEQIDRLDVRVDDEWVPARVVVLSPKGSSDLAVIALESPRPLAELPLLPIQPAVGTEVHIDSALHGESSGTVERYGYELTDEKPVIGEARFDRPIVAGDSGSALIANGRLVGVIQGSSVDLGDFVPGDVVADWLAKHLPAPEGTAEKSQPNNDLPLLAP